MIPTPTLGPGALADLRVLELGTLIAGPFCGQLLGDMGAEVIKIEPPGQGDPMRHWGPQKRGQPSVWWPVIGRNKKAVTLDLRQEAGQNLFKELVQRADVVIENFRPGTLEKWSCGWQELSQLNPRLILTRVSGYGQTGPYSQRAGYGGIGEAMGGLRYIVGEPDRPPSRVGISIGDSLAGVHACMGTLAALHHRDRTGIGQVVDAAIYESVLNMMESLVTEYDQLGHVRERSGAILPRIAPSNVYPTRDGIVMIGANQDTVFTRLAAAMNAPELASDTRYQDHEARGTHQQELDDIIARWTATQGTRELLDLLERHGVPSGLIYRTSDMLEDPHFAAREAIVETTHPQFGTLRMQNVAPRLSASPGSIRTPAPSIGQHNSEIYEGLLGLDAAAMAKLRGQGVI
ncbi:MAG TPA: CoA transferase [Steroidobacteraceae bacterium]|jgi:formyl-CoA transferase|nr:CoA transferase [Steroidobacteraceae bacterium]